MAGSSFELNRFIFVGSPMESFKKIFLILAGLITSACSDAGLAAVNIPAGFKSGQVVENVSYGTLPLQKMDIYIPDVKAAENLPVIIFMHGGRWTDGDKNQYAFMGKKLNEYGFITVIPNYRKYPDIKFPIFIEDTARAISYTYDHIAEYNGNPNNIHLMGHSSGAHMAALAIADRSYLNAFDKTPDIIKSFAGLSGPYDFVPQARDIKSIFAPPENYPKMQVTNFIDGTEPPMLLVHGRDDDTVELPNLEKLARGINAHNGHVETLIPDGINHTDPVRDFTWADINGIDIPKAVTDFFNRNMN